MTALVGCASIGTATGEPMEINELILEVLGGKLSSTDIKDQFRNHRGSEAKLGVYTIGELVESCEPSVEKCSPGQFYRLVNMESFYKSNSELHAYLSSCKDEFVKVCSAHIDQVSENILKDTSKIDEHLMRPFWKRLSNGNVADPNFQLAIETEGATMDGRKIEQESKIFHNEITAAYYQCMNENYGGEISIDQEELFLNKFLLSVHRYKSIDDFLRHIVPEADLGEGNQSTKELIEKCQIANDFLEYPYVNIWIKLREKISEETGIKDERTIFDFEEQTEEEILEGQKNRRAAAAARAMTKGNVPEQDSASDSIGLVET